MFDLINNIEKNCILEIRGKRYEVLAKVLYVTETETKNWYAKIQLQNHHVLVISPYDDFMYFGYVAEPLNYSFPTPDIIKFNDKIFKKDADDYQMVKEFIFGNYLEMEGEVQFSDFSNENDIISLGIITRTSKRADVIASVVDLKDIKLFKNEI
ncbi:hypothetical protein [Thomasclavelia cocleata]|nr:hypothetical protein [Thomasclavelia cocleata]